MAKSNLKLTFDSNLTNIVSCNDSFDTGVLYIAYHGDNRNRSSISKSVFEKCAHTMYNVPVVANYIREDDTIGGHDMEIVRKDGTPTMVNLTHPVGVVPESARYWWDTVEEEDGTEHEYLCADVLLWKRQEAYAAIKENGITSESMEIAVKSGKMKNGIYHIEDFQFLAFCLLGNCEPCFESASLATFSSDSFEAEFRSMLDDLPGAIRKYKEEVTNEAMNRKMKLMAQYGLTLDDLDFELSDFTIDELKQKFESIKKKFDDDPDPDVDPDNGETETGEENGGGGTGGDPAGDSGGETGGESGGETGGESGGETGGESGGETGGESGGETGGDSTGETNGEAGGNDSGTTGDSGGGSDSGNPGTSSSESGGGSGGNDSGGSGSGGAGNDSGATGGSDNSGSSDTEESQESNQGDEDDEVVKAPRRVGYALDSELNKELRCAVNRETFVDDWGDTYSRFWIIDYDVEQKLVYCVDCKCDGIIVRMNWEYDGDSVVVDFDSAVRVKPTFVDYIEGSAQTEQFAVTLNDYAQRVVSVVTSKFAAERHTMQSELNSLREFKAQADKTKRSADEDALFEMFSDLTGVAEFEALRSDCAGMELDAVEEKCFAIRGRQMNFSVKPKKKHSTVLPVDNVGLKTDYEPYGDVFEKFGARR